MAANKLTLIQKSVSKLTSQHKSATKELLPLKKSKGSWNEKSKRQTAETGGWKAGHATGDKRLESKRFKEGKQLENRGSRGG